MSGFEEAAAIAAILGAAATAAKTGYDFANPQKAAKLPTPVPMDTTAIAKANLPSAKADAAARVGGGVAPEFVASLVDQQSGTPGSGLDILSEIRRSIGGGTQAP